jgi:hypothetical protein
LKKNAKVELSCLQYMQSSAGFTTSRLSRTSQRHWRRLSYRLWCCQRTRRCHWHLVESWVASVAATHGGPKRPSAERALGNAGACSFSTARLKLYRFYDYSSAPRPGRAEKMADASRDAAGACQCRSVVCVLHCVVCVYVVPARDAGVQACGSFKFKFSVWCHFRVVYSALCNDG